jgi:PST family polysaccharide transporter
MLKRLFARKIVQDTLALQAGKLISTALSLAASLIIWRLLGPEEYGTFGLAMSFMALWYTLDLTGISTSISTRLGIAVGKADERAMLYELAVYAQVTLVVSFSLALLLAVIGQPIAAQLHPQETQIGLLAALLAFANPADTQYSLVMVALASRRQMKSMALLQTLNQVILSLSMIAAVLVSPAAESLVIARLVYSYSTLLLAWWFYQRLRLQASPALPPLFDIYRHIFSVSPRGQIGFGITNALDKNLAALFIQLPQQFVGALAGERAAGYLAMGLSVMANLSVLSSAVFDNMQAIIPQLVGRHDYAHLRQQFGRVLLLLAGGAIVLYSTTALLIPLVIPLLLGEEWWLAVSAAIVLCWYGAITTVGGVFGPLYRALNLVRSALLGKIAALLIVLPTAYGLLTAQMGGAALSQAEAVDMMQPAIGALAGAWMINGLFTLATVITGFMVWRGLQKVRLPSESA